MQSSGYLRLNSITSNVDGSRVDFESTTNPYENVKGFQLNNIKVYDYYHTLFKNIKLNYTCPDIVGGTTNVPTYLAAESYKRFFFKYNYCKTYR